MNELLLTPDDRDLILAALARMAYDLETGACKPVLPDATATQLGGLMLKLVEWRDHTQIVLRCDSQPADL